MVCTVFQADLSALPLGCPTKSIHCHCCYCSIFGESKTHFQGLGYIESLSYRNGRVHLTKRISQNLSFHCKPVSIRFFLSLQLAIASSFASASGRNAQNTNTTFASMNKDLGHFVVSEINPATVFSACEVQDSCRYIGQS